MIFHLLSVHSYLSYVTSFFIIRLFRLDWRNFIQAWWATLICFTANSILHCMQPFWILHLRDNHLSQSFLVMNSWMDPFPFPLIRMQWKKFASVLLCTCKMYLVFLLSSLHTPSNLINIQGHELEGAFIVRALACLEIHGQITLLKYVLTYSLFQFWKESLALLFKKLG